MKVMRRARFLLAFVGVIACDEETGPNVSGVETLAITSVRVTPGVDTIFIPDTVRASDRIFLTAQAIDRTLNPLAGVVFAWKSSDLSVASVDAQGVVTPVGPGTAVISASAGRVGHATVVVLPATETVSISPLVDTVLSNDPEIPPRDTARFVATARDRFGNLLTGVSFSWQASVGASIDNSGLARAVSPATAGIAVSSAGHQAAATLVVLNATQTVTVAPLVDSIFVDDPIVPATDVQAFTAVARDPYGGVLTKATFTWQSSAAPVATVDAGGTAHAVTLGATTITVLSGGRQATAALTVVPKVKNVVAATPVTQVLAGDTVQLSATAFDYSNAPMPRTFAWTSSAPNVATVNSAGRVIFVTPGTATFTATTAFRTSQVTVTALPRQLLTLDAGGDYSCGITPLGRGYCWGLGDFGQLASAADSNCFEVNLPRRGCTLLPKRMAGDVEFITVSAGESVACGIATTQHLYCWGDDSHGEIGNGSTGSAVEPNLATVGNQRFASVSAGSTHACALNLTGTAYCWGNDLFGQLGDHRLINSTTPIPVRTTITFSAISAGGNHTCAIATAAGTAWCWGSGAMGQLGVGAVIQSDIPVTVVGVLNFTAISAGGRHTCGIVVGGTAYCWGDNSSGQLGRGGDPTLPLPVPGGTFIAISAGDSHTCGIATGGSVRCWGSSSHGQVGDAIIGPHNQGAPVAVAGSFTATAITAGFRHTCAIGTDTQAYCWGSNVYGALGNELQAAVRETPQLVARPR